MDKGISVIALYCIAILFLGKFVYSKQCVKRSNCICVFDDGSGMIDLTPLGHSDGTALFKDQPATLDQYWYSFNPCGAFNDVSCVNVAACQYDPLNYIFYDIGVPDKVSFNYDGQNVIAQYQSFDGTRKTFVTLVCDNKATTPTLNVEGEKETTQYFMTMTSVQACAVPSPSTYDESSEGLSGGSVLLIIFFVLLFVYMAAGIAFNKFRHEAKGLELLPNLGFWSKLPGLIRDGCAYSMAVVCRKRSVYVTM